MANAIVITGGGRGIGAATARLAARRGYAVVVNYRTDAAAAEAVVEAIVAEGGRALAIAADVSRELEVERLFARVDAELGRIDALVNNAGVVDVLARVDAMSEARIRRMQSCGCADRNRATAPQRFSTSPAAAERRLPPR